MSSKLLFLKKQGGECGTQKSKGGVWAAADTVRELDGLSEVVYTMYPRVDSFCLHWPVTKASHEMLTTDGCHLFKTEQGRRAEVGTDTASLKTSPSATLAHHREKDHGCH